MKIFLALVLMLLCACQPRSFSGRVEFKMAMQPNQWDSFLVESDKLLPPSIYNGKNGEVVLTTGAPPILYVEKTSQDARYKVVAAQRTGRKYLSVILYTSDAKPDDMEWRREAGRLETILRNRYGDSLSVNYGPVTESPF